MTRVLSTGLAAMLFAASGCVISPEPAPPPEQPPCAPDDSLVCVQGDGWSCAAGYDPTQVASNLSCSLPTADGPNDDFCCFVWTFGSTCVPDDGLTSVCQPGTFGYRCQAGDDPSSLDPSLHCSPPTPNGPDDDFCCG